MQEYTTPEYIMTSLPKAEPFVKAAVPISKSYTDNIFSTVHKTRRAVKSQFELLFFFRRVKMKPTLRFLFEMAVTALFALVFSFLASQFLHKCTDKDQPKEHMFNNTDMFLTSYFTALMVFVMLRVFNWREAFKK